MEMSIQVLNQYRNISDIWLTGGNLSASDAAWGDLYVRLSQEPYLNGYNVILNENGQIVDRSPSALATLLRNAPIPTVWIDYGGWPMAYAGDWWTFGKPFIWDLSRFATFVRGLDARLMAQSLPNPTFGTHATQELAFDRPDDSRYVWPAGLSVNTDLSNSPWRDDGSPDGGGYWVDSRYYVLGEIWKGYEQNTYGCFGIRHGRNWYFWAFGTADQTSTSVPSSDYADFIHWAFWQWKTGGAGPIQGPPIPPGWEPPGGGQTPGADQTPSSLAKWWQGLPITEKAAILFGSTALVAGSFLLLQDPRKREG